MATPHECLTPIGVRGADSPRQFHSEGEHSSSKAQSLREPAQPSAAFAQRLDDGPGRRGLTRGPGVGRSPLARGECS